jgi:protein ImuA
LVRLHLLQANIRLDKVLVMFFCDLIMREHKLSSLRALLAKPEFEDVAPRVASGHAALDLCLKGGLQVGALHEVYGVQGHEASATGFAAALAQRLSPAKPILWIGQDFAAQEFGQICATGLLEFGLHPSRLLFLRVNHFSDALKAAGDALSCSALGCVVIETMGFQKLLDLTATRRLALAAAQKQVSTLLLRFNAVPEASATETRWQVKAGFNAKLLRNRHGQNGQVGEWGVAWSYDDGIFEKPKADFGAVVLPAADRQVAAA